MSEPQFPFNRALSEGTFPENLENLGLAARDMVREYREYVALIYVDVVEFEGAHVRQFYEDMAVRFDAFFKKHGMENELQSKLANGLSPISAVMLATRIFMNYFSVYIFFGAKNYFVHITKYAICE